MTIKVGQVYKKTDTSKDWRFVITHVSGGERYFDYIFEDGCTIADDDEYGVLDNAVLLAEYPTWLEAINSPHFNRSIKNLGGM